MPVKELSAATAILVVCIGLLWMAHSEPGTQDAEILEGPSIVGIDQPGAPPADRVPMPPSGNDLASNDRNETSFDDLGFADVGQPSTSPSGSDGFDAITFDDEPVIADAGTSPSRPADGLIARAVGQLRDDTPSQLPAGGFDDEVEVPQVPAAPSASTSGGTTHVVSRGEMLMDISFKHYGTHHRWREIAEANDVDPNDLQVGQKLAIPKLDNVVPAATHGQASGDAYVVKKGDMYYTIARDVLGDAGRVKELQQLNDVDAHDLRPGMVIRLPKGPRLAATGRATPQAAAETPVPLPSGARWHIVERGEVLGTISQKYYGTSKRWRDIAEANGINDPGDLRSGQKLVIPNAPASAPAAISTPSKPKTSSNNKPGSGNGTWHEVGRGEVLSEISQRYYGTSGRWRELVEANSGINPNKLVVGSRLWIPGAASQRRQAPTPAPTPVPTQRESFSWPELNDAEPAPATGGSNDDPFGGL